VLDGRYHPEPTEDEQKQGIVPEPVKESGDWTVEALTPEVEKNLRDMIKVLKQKVAERDAAVERGEQVGDTRPGWRVLRAEVWRQFGTLLDVEKAWDKDEDALVKLCVEGVTASLIQQRERLYDLTHTRMAAVIEQVLDPEMVEDEWDWDQLEDALTEQFNMQIEVDPATPDEAAHQIWPKLEKKLGEREKELSRAFLMYFQRKFALDEIDQQWIEHLKTMDALREGIGLQGYGQKDPKKEYKKAGFSLFTEMMDRIQENTVQKLFRVQIQKQEEQVPAVHVKERQMVEKGVADKSEDEADEQQQDQAAKRSRKARTTGDGPRTEPVKRDRPKVGRNDPCPCGSGKKYKKCHGKDEEASASE
jgi:preprotein translocase subunit SecA